MLELHEVLAVGRTRTVYTHPNRSDRIVKVENRPRWRDADKLILRAKALLAPSGLWPSDNRRELWAASQIGSRLDPFIPVYERELQQTNRGLGLICEAIVDHNGIASPGLKEFGLDAIAQTQTVRAQLQELFDRLFTDDLFFYDFNLDNFLIQTGEGNDVRVRFIDLKGYRRDRSLMQITRFSMAAARSKMERRARRFWRRIDQR